MRGALLRAGAIALAAMIVLASCGGDDDDSADDATEDESGGSDDGGEEATDAPAEDYVTAVADTLSDQEQGMGIDEAGATCMAQALVDGIGVDALHDAGVEPQEFAEADDVVSLEVDAPDSAASDISAELTDCEVVGEIEAAFLGPEITSQSTCVADALDDQQLIDALAESFIDLEEGSSAITDALEPAIAACPSEMTELVFQVFSQSQGAEPPAEVRSCVEGYVEENADQVAATLTGGDEEATSALVEEIRSACPGF